MGLTVLLGGARSGKSRWAVRLAGEAGGPVAFIATGEARDAEMTERIARHRRQRPASWTTIEEPRELAAAIGAVEGERTVIVDCLTLWVANLLEDGLAASQVRDRARRAAGVAAAYRGEVIAVSNEVGSGIVPANELGRRYRDLLGEVNTAWADHAARAALVIAGRLLWLPPASGDGGSL
jgi:adenosyl cobinamide kinase/adenosyl cobinamide phosphate guanylyltransferase